MERYDTCKDIAFRTNGELFIGVVGPVRTGKSTFITKFIEKFVLPNINNKLQKQIATDEMPQSADGKAVMTTQPRFIPANAVKVQFKNKVSAQVRLIDCVGYMVDGALGGVEDDKPRLVKTPWHEKEIPFELAAEIGTRKVVEEYSTVAIVVTCDGTFSDIERKNYVPAEEKVINELKALNKPFVVVLNSAEPESESSLKLASEMQEKYGVFVVCCDVSSLNEDKINEIMEKILYDFPLLNINVNLPKWLEALPLENDIIQEIIEGIKSSSNNACKMKDFSVLQNAYSQSKNILGLELEELNLAKGAIEYNLTTKEDLFYRVLSKECGEEILDDYSLMSYIKGFSECKTKYAKIKDALYEAENVGYGVVLPSVDELELEQPALVKQGGRYAVKLKASAPSLHIIKVDVGTEISPTVGSEKQGQDMVDYISNKYDKEPNEIWKTDMFGKSLHEMINEGMADKLKGIPDDAQKKMRKTLTRMVNENKGGLICILL